MKLVIQRCSEASVLIDNNIKQDINKGLVVFLGISNSDTEKDIDYLIHKLVNIRVFEDDNQKLNYSVKDIEAEILLISQFTLYANTNNGNRPSFENCMKFSDAKKLYDIFVDKLEKETKKLKTGNFGSIMKVSLTNDGPVTIILDSNN